VAIIENSRLIQGSGFTRFVNAGLPEKAFGSSALAESQDFGDIGRNGGDGASIPDEVNI
jgi:hypothetical protein